MRKLKAVDLFCGAGGTSTGAEQSGAAQVVCAVNHWGVAVATHSLNFPHTRHINSRVDQIKPGDIPKHDLLFASPECVGHSIARGGRPTSDQQRAGAWDIMPFLEYHRPSFAVIENVRELMWWGPCGKNGRPLKSMRGSIFSVWIKAIEGHGYKVDYHILNAADYGAATSRERLIVIARKGNRYPVFPEPTHSRNAGGELPGMGKLPWRSAAEIIDWSIPCRSVFLRSKPLADNTLYRLEAGLRKFVGPFVATHRSTSGQTGSGGTTRDPSSPLGTITANGMHHGLAVPFSVAWDQSSGSGTPSGNCEPLPTIVTKANRGVAVPWLTACGGRAGQTPPTPIDDPCGTLTTKADRCVAVPWIMSSQSEGAPRGVSSPTPTQTAHGGVHLVIPFLSSFHNGNDGSQRNYPLGSTIPTLDTQNRFGLATPYMVDVNHSGVDRRVQSADDPLGTVTGSRGKAVAVPFLMPYYATGVPYGVHEPLHTVTTKDRHGLVYAIVECAPVIEPRNEAERKLLATMRELGVADLGFRMLANHELSLAQGFPADYQFTGTKAEITKQIGNSVSPPKAEAITLSLAG